MGIGLMVEVLMHAPPELGPSERMVLVVIAENARDTTRESWKLTRADICQRAGMSSEALRKAFQRLAKAGLEVRVPLKFNQEGRPVFAYEGKQSTYRLPPLQRWEQSPTSEAGTDSRLSPQEAGTESHLSPSEEGLISHLFGPEVGTESAEVGTDSRPTPHNPSSTSPSEKYKGGAGGTKRARKSDDEHPRFAEFYAAYPKKVDPGDARRAFNRAVKKVDDPQTLIDGAHRYAREKATTEKRYIKAPAVWLNKESWLNEPETPLAATGTDGRPANRFGPLANVNDEWAQVDPENFHPFQQKGNRQ